MHDLPTDLFDFMAISIPAGEEAAYFYGDNLKGFFEGRTHRTEAGEGYLIRDRALVRGLFSAAGPRWRRREQAAGATLYPYGVRHAFGPGCWDEVMLLPRATALALRVHHDRPARLGAALALDLPAAGLRITRRAGAWVIASPATGEYIGLAATAPLAFERVRRAGRFAAPAFRATRPVAELTVYAALAADPADAARRVLALRDDDAVARHRTDLHALLTASHLDTGHPRYDRAVLWAALTSYFLVVEEFGKGIWAGLPWFRDNWGRDTFIALPGTLLVTGRFAEAKDVIRNFLRYQNTDPASPDYGRVPNRVASATDIIYNTTDGTPWLIREIHETLCYTGDRAFAAEVYPAVKLALDGALRRYADREGFLTHADADTWMDARIMGNLPWSARGNRANDIQALWFAALQAGVVLAGLARDRAAAQRWSAAAAKVKRHFTKRFWDPARRRLADRIDAAGQPDYRVRPNQLMVLTVPIDGALLDEKRAERVVRNAVGELLYPYGIASLSQRDPYFHPYHHNDAWHHFDAAYHNGTVWGWNAGFTVTALCRHGQQELAWKLAGNLAGQILDLGCRGSMSELIVAMPDARGKITLSGTWAQAWSTSEFARNAFQDFAGFAPRLLDGVVRLQPSLPAGIKRLHAVFAFGTGAALDLRITRRTGRAVVEAVFRDHPEPLKIDLAFDHAGRRYRVARRLAAGQTLRLGIDRDGTAVARIDDGRETPVRGEKRPAVKLLGFVQPSLAAKPRSIREQDFLQKRIEAGRY